jgi:hypothetical protein
MDARRRLKGYGGLFWWKTKDYSVDGYFVDGYSMDGYSTRSTQHASLST